MFAARRFLNPTKSVAKSVTVATQRRANSSSTASVPGFLYNNVWMKSTPLYIGYIFAGAVVVELFYGVATNAIFDVVNRGKLFDHCNMAQYGLEGDDDDDDDEDEE